MQKARQQVRCGHVVSAKQNKAAAAAAQAFAGGWFHPRDLAVVWPVGALQMTDCANDALLLGGKNTSCIAVEAVLHQHTDTERARA
ncbi:MAG: hypothetical protein K2Q97_01150 [Burkholderiaceae bacterium]|nr:hypothetical protein [Burkholderiaceae bacterium]